jgi:hypothetical protein
LIVAAIARVVKTEALNASLQHEETYGDAAEASPQEYGSICDQDFVAAIEALKT